MEYTLRTVEVRAAMDTAQFDRPFIDNNLRNPKEMHRLVRRLFGLGLVTFRRKARAKVGVFTVAKKDGMLRLVSDCRPANALHKDPPITHLASGSAYGNFDWSDESLGTDTHGDADLHFSALRPH